MKLKSLLAIVSCSAIALSIGIPSVADTVKDSQVESSSIGIGNKDYRNKQSTPLIVGSWYSSVEDNEHRHTDPVEIYADFKADGTQNSASRRENGEGFSNISYKYAPTKSKNLGALVQEDNEGRTFLSVVRWISSNEFIITLVKDSHEPHRNGLKRRFVRINEPVATQIQQRAQQASKTQQDALRRARTEGQLRAIPYQNRVLTDVFRGSGY